MTVAACLLAGLVVWVLVQMLVRRRITAVGPTRKLLVLDMSYTLEQVRSRQLHEPILARDLDGFFTHVWSVHPCATLDAPHRPDGIGRFVVVPFADRHTVVEGKIGRFPALRAWPTMNFVIAQYELLRYLDQLIASAGISAVRAGEPYYTGLWALALARMNGIPSVFRIPINFDTFYESLGRVAFPRLFRWRLVEQIISRITLTRADLVAGSNQDSLDFALANGAKAEHSTLFRVGNLIHKAHFQPPSERPDADALLHELGLLGKTFSITVCRLEPLKHVDDVLRAVSQARSEGLDLCALIVGDGRLKDDLVTLAKSLGIADAAVFAGNRTQEWIAAVLPRAAVVLSPHMGRGLTEALLSETPAVAYDVEWQAEIVRPGETGELVPYRDWQEMARAIRRLGADPERAQQLGRDARAFTLNMMDPARLSQHERDEYLKLFARAGAPTG